MQLALYKVAGQSMLPNYGDGDYVLAFRCCLLRLAAGDVVVVRHPHFGNLIKRIQRIENAATLIIAGDNALSSTKRDALSPIAMHQVLGKVIWRIAAPSNVAAPAKGRCA